MVDISNFVIPEMDGMQLSQQFFGDGEDMGLEQDEIVMSSDQFGPDVCLLYMFSHSAVIIYHFQGVFQFGDDFKGPMSAGPRAVHQCNICNKIFVSFKG